MAANLIVLMFCFFLEEGGGVSFFLSPGFLGVDGLSPSVSKVGVRVPIDFSRTCDIRPQKMLCHLRDNRLQEEDCCQENV